MFASDTDEWGSAAVGAPVAPLPFPQTAFRFSVLVYASELLGAQTKSHGEGGCAALLVLHDLPFTDQRSG